MYETIEVLIKGLVMILVLMGAAGYCVLCERVVLARLQMRVGPNRAGPFGLFLPIADAVKLVLKESFQPTHVEKFIYWLAPGISLFTAFFAFLLIPIGGTVEIFGHQVALRIADVNAGVIFFLAFSSLAVYGVVLAGWASNSRYSLLGGLRGTAQLISYEVPMGLSLLTVVLAAGTLSLPEIVEAQRSQWFVWTHPISFIIYVITAFAETNRSPFDLPESEQELTGGYHTEYGGVKFAIFFLAEYVNILAVSSIGVTLFLGGWLGPWDLPVVWYLVKIAICLFFFIWVRASLPRFRYDQLMSFGWKVLIPIATINLIITSYLILVVK